MCLSQKSTNQMKKITCILAASTLLFTTVSFAQTSDVATQTEQQAEQEKSTVSLKVSGITCGHDLKTLNEKLKAIKGVYNCETVGRRGVKTNFKVDYNPNLITEKEIRAAFEGTPGCEDPNEFPYKVKS